MPAPSAGQSGRVPGVGASSLTGSVPLTPGALSPLVYNKNQNHCLPCVFAVFPHLLASPPTICFPSVLGLVGKSEGYLTGMGPGL